MGGAAVVLQENKGGGGGMGQGYASSGLMLAGSLEPDITNISQYSLLGSNQSNHSLRNKVIYDNLQSKSSR